MLSARSSEKLVVAGHHHRNSIERFANEGKNEIFQVRTSAIAKRIDNWRQIRFTENQIFVSLPGKTERELLVPIE
jgi:hypothetical protein